MMVCLQTEPIQPQSWKVTTKAPCFGRMAQKPLELHGPIKVSDCHGFEAKFGFFSTSTPCGHEVIVEGREEQTDGGERTKSKPTQTKHPSPQAETPPSCSLSSTLGETCETETSGTFSVGDQRPHHSGQNKVTLQVAMLQQCCDQVDQVCEDLSPWKRPFLLQLVAHDQSQQDSNMAAIQQRSLPTGEALRGDTGFASVFGPQNEGHKFTRKCNLTLDTSMAKPTPKPLLRMVEREEYSECLGASVERPV